MLKSLKHAKVRENSSYIQVCASVNCVRYRFTTKLAVSKENLEYVEKNYQTLIHEYILAQNANDSNIGISLQEYGQKVLEYERTRLKENTYIRYMNVFNKYIATRLGEEKVESITPKVARDIFSNTFSDVSLHNKVICLAVLNAIFNTAVIDEMIANNPFMYIKISRKKHIPTHRNRALSKEEIQKILANVKDKTLATYLRIAFFTGMRTNEILALQKEDIDFNNGIIQVNKSLCNGHIDTTKTQTSQRNIDMLDVLNPTLKNLESGFIFKKDNKILNQRQITRKFKNLLKTLEIAPTTLYATRHSFASMMLQEGEDILWVSNMLGHKDIAVTLKHYAKYMRSDKKRAAFTESIFAS